jgi:hypothetical protein
MELRLSSGQFTTGLIVRSEGQSHVPWMMKLPPKCVPMACLSLENSSQALLQEYCKYNSTTCISMHFQYIPIYIYLIIKV